MNHTAGNWVADFDDFDAESGTVAISVRNGWGSFARVVVEMEDSGPSEEGKANAHLIAASPKMLDALQEVLDVMESRPELKELDGSFPRGSLFGIVRAAIVAAKGEGQ